MKLNEIATIMMGILVKRESREYGENSYKLFSLKNYEEGQEYEEFVTDKNFSDKLTQKRRFIVSFVISE